MRTPWKLLYDWTKPILEWDLGPAGYRVTGQIWGFCIVAPMAVLVWFVGLVTKWIAPASNLAAYLESHFWGPVIALSFIYFFYWFFRLVWDGMNIPAKQKHSDEASNG